MADELVIQNPTVIQVIETAVPNAVVINSILGTATVVETINPANVEIISSTTGVQTLEVPAQTALDVEVLTTSALELTLAMGPTGYTPQLYSGAAPPDPAVGTVGDLFLVNTGGTIGDLYQKTAAGWGTSKGNLRGGIASVNGISGTNITIGANNITTGVLPIAQVPTGTTSTTVALGNHNHDTAYVGLSGTQTVSGAKTFSSILEAAAGSGGLKLSAGATDHTYMTFYARTGAPGVRSGYIGYGGGGTTTLNLNNELSAGAINITTTGGGNIVLTGALIQAAGNFHTTGGLRVGTTATAGYVLTADASGNATWQQTANIIVPGTTAQYYRGDLTWQTLNATAVGLGNVTNTSDAAKPVSTAQQTALDLKANLAGPTFTGTVTVSTIAGVTPTMVGLGNVANLAQVDLVNNQTIAGTKSFTSEIVGPTSGNVLKVGDDARIADVSIANVIGIIGQTNSALGGIALGSAATVTFISTAATAATLTASGGLTITGAVSASSTLLVGTALTVNTTSNLIGAVTMGAALTVTGTITGNGGGITNLQAPNLTGTIAIARIPVGTTGTDVAAGNHAHTGVYEPAYAVGTTAQYYRGDKSWQALNASAVGLGNVANLVQVDLVNGQTITGAKVMNNASNAFTGSGAGLTALNADQLTTGTVAQARTVPNTQKFLFTTGSEARPTGTTYVEWIGPVQPANATTNDTWTDTSLQIIEDPVISMPVGTIQMYAASSSPTNWFVCNGQAISRTTYATLFALIGTTYGTGDGSTTFNIPNVQGRVAVGYMPSNTKFDTMGETGGAETVTLTTAQMPVHNHTITDPGHNHALDGHTWSWAGAAAGVNSVYAAGAQATSGNPPSNELNTKQGIWTTALTNYTGITVQNAGSGSAHENMPPYIALNYIIKVL